jgi:cytochrome c-type biogenesis protein CcmH/NrfG
MTGRNDLDELQALAASIAEDTHGWRAHRRGRAHAAARRRLEAEMVAPVKRRRRHRWLAAGTVALVAVVATFLVVTHKPSQPAPAQKRTIVTVRHMPSQVRVGQDAAIALHQLGRDANVFACEGWYESQHLASVPSQAASTWRAGYLQACAEGG